MFEKQKDKPDPDVLLEMASYYVVSVEAMNKRVMDVSVFCTSRKHYIVAVSYTHLTLPTNREV